MYVKDNFLEPNSELLERLKNKKPWAALDEIQPPVTSRWWDGTGRIDNIWKELIVRMWGSVLEHKTFGCFEYWVNITEPNVPLEWHQDKDEFEYEKSGKIICPSTSTVFYGYPHEVEGGYLEINAVDKDGGIDIERIKPVYNRIAVFNPSRVHRVSPITKGERYGFQVNIWDTIPKGALPFLEGENNE